jgi:hypothetical protein
VSATSTVKDTPPMVTVGIVLAGVVPVGNDEGVGGGVGGTFVGTWVGLTVGSGGITLDTGAAVGALVGVAVAVAGWLWGTSPPQDVITTDTRPIAVQINRICKAR